MNIFNNKFNLKTKKMSTEKSTLKAIEGMIELLEFAKKDAEKFDSGNNAAGGRVRKSMQDLKKAAQELRIAVQEQKNSSKK